MAPLLLEGSMFYFILNRLAQALLVMAVVSAISFSLFNFVGDPVNNMVGQDATREQRIEIRQQLGLDDPILVQYQRFMLNVAQGDFGLSYRIKQPVSQLILERLPATLELVFASAVIAVLIGIVLGVYTGIRRYSWVSKIIMSVSLIGVSLPTFIIGIGLIYLFAVHLRWLPSSGRAGVIELGGWKTSLLTIDGWRSIILPAVTLSLFQLMILRLVRAEMLEVMRSDYIKFESSRFGNRAIHFGHALRHTCPRDNNNWLKYRGTYSIFCYYRNGFPMAGDWPDVYSGSRLCRCTYNGTYLIFVALLFVVINLIVDILYFVDPRIRRGGS